MIKNLDDHRDSNVTPDDHPYKHIQVTRCIQCIQMHHPLDARYDSVVDEPHQWS
jgi:hypothetical protein